MAMAMGAPPFFSTKTTIHIPPFPPSSFPFFHHHHHQRLPPFSRRLSLRAAKSHSGPVEKKPTNSNKRNKKPKRRLDDDPGLAFSEVEIVQSKSQTKTKTKAQTQTHAQAQVQAQAHHDDLEEPRSLGYYAAPLPNPPAGFVLDEQGRVLLVSNKRIATIVDPTNNFPLECTIRRVFKSSRGDDCMLLCPIDTPVQMLKSTNIEGWSAVSDEEVETILPTAAFALAKIHMHLVHSGFCFTARGGFCYTEDDIFDFRSDDGQDVDGLPTEGVEITCFNLDGAHYMIYTPADPLLFVAVKDDNGMLRIADDDLLDDSAVISAIDEETEYNALVEEEAALLDSLLGKE